MPRIDPLQLINCLQILLNSSGGISSKNEIQRLVNLMTKFSKKLVSKCVYVLILKNTERTLLGEFMGVGGWGLIQLWLHDAITSMNWALVKEVLELLLITPVDVERLKSNNIPKLVKNLSKQEDINGVKELSNQLVQQWLKLVKDETQSDQAAQQQRQVKTLVSVSSADGHLVAIPVIQMAPNADSEENSVDIEGAVNKGLSTQTYYKLTLKDGKHLISKVSPNEANCTVENIEVVDVNNLGETITRDKEKDDKKRSLDKHGKHRSSSKSGSRDKERSSSHSKSKHSSSSSKDRDRSRDKDRHRDKDKHRSNGSVKSSSSSSSSSSKNSSSSKSKDKKDSKEKQAEKDKDTLAKIQPHSLQKLPKIPKKSSEDKAKDEKEPKKGTMSIEVRKNNEERPKTVKVYKSKMRSTGLEEEAKPAPPRPVKKPVTTTVTSPAVPVKRPSPTRDVSVPPEKKTKTEAPLEKPGSIKLIPPKPKPSVLLDSNMFMDALAASATVKKEPKKRKRRASVSKDSSGASPPSSPTVPSGGSTASSPIALKNMVAPKFYQDTLDTDDPKAESGNGELDYIKEEVKDNEDEMMEGEDIDRSSTPIQDLEEIKKETPTRSNNNQQLKGVLVYVRNKGPKKSIKWKPDEELVQVQYFELDETERVNVTKTFMDMAKQDVRGEREALQMSRKLPNEDVMDVQTPWRIPFEIDIEPPSTEPGSKSLEKNIQFAREKSVLQAIYFNRKTIPEYPAEPDLETYQIKDPIVIPIEDSEQVNQDRPIAPWPEPKGSPPRQNVPNNMPMFQNPGAPFPNFGMGPPTGFQNMQPNIQPFGNPGFGPQNMMGGGVGGGAGGEWNNMNMSPNMHNQPMMGPNMGPPEMMNQGPMNPNMFMPPPDNFNPMMNDNNHRFPGPGPGPGPGGPGPGPFNQQGPPGMFPPHQNNFNSGRGGGHFRRGAWVRMNVPGPGPGGWNNMRGGGGNGPHRGGVRICHSFRNKGFCRNGDNCPYFHPNN